MFRNIKGLVSIAFVFSYLTTAQAGQATLAWDANTEATLGGYKLFYGQTSGNYSANVDVGKTTSYTLNLQDGTTYYFAVKAYNSTRTAESGFSNEVSKTIGTTPPPSGSLPVPWLHWDVGNVGLVGSASVASGTFTVKGSGNDIWGTTDAFHFVYQPWSGNGTIVARVASITNTNSWAKAGVMIRANLDPNAPYAMVALTPANGITFQRRYVTGGSSYYTAGAAVKAPYWVRLVRSSNTFTAYQSADGSTWALIGSRTMTNMPTSVYVGLAVTSHNNSVLNTATLDNVKVLSVSQ